MASDDHSARNHTQRTSNILTMPIMFLLLKGFDSGAHWSVTHYTSVLGNDQSRLDAKAKQNVIFT